MKEKTFNLIELFSGIGSQVEALNNIGAKVNVLNTCEWNMHSIVAYSVIHDMMDVSATENLTKEELVDYLLNAGISNDGKEPVNIKGLQRLNESALNRIYGAIQSTRNLVDISKVDGKNLAGDIDILTYSFPCQDLSNVGAFHGYKKGIDRDAQNRSGLLWEVERILLERKEADMFLPHFLLMENVPALNSQRHRKNFEEWQHQLEKLGYHNKQYVLNAKDFGLPQNRERLLMLSVLTNGDLDATNAVDEYFTNNDINPKEYLKATGKDKTKLKYFLRTNYTKEKYRIEALECQPNNTVSRQKIWDNNIQLTDDKGVVKDVVTSTLTTKQDRHPNSGNLRVDFENDRARFRYLTPRECFLLMGFKESDFDRLLDNNFEAIKNVNFFTRDNLIQMAGNSIAVNVLEAIFRKVVELDELLYI